MNVAHCLTFPWLFFIWYCFQHTRSFFWPYVCCEGTLFVGTENKNVILSSGNIYMWRFILNVRRTFFSKLRTEGGWVTGREQGCQFFILPVCEDLTCFLSVPDSWLFYPAKRQLLWHSPVLFWADSSGGYREGGRPKAWKAAQRTDLQLKLPVG